MAKIGTFTQKDGKYTGTIRTMTINVKSTFVPNDKKGNDKAPDFRIFAGGAELGAAWRSKAKGGEEGDYLSVELDDPSFDKPIRAAFFFSDDKAGKPIGTLHWSRPPKLTSKPASAKAA